MPSVGRRIPRGLPNRHTLHRMAGARLARDASIPWARGKIHAEEPEGGA